MKIILFEDGEQAAAIRQELQRLLGTGGTASIFTPPPEDDQECMHEDKLERDIRAAGYQDATLIVADRDLSRLDTYRGLSESTVRRVADKLAIPECGYARGERPAQDPLELREERISVSTAQDTPQFARQVVAIARGFAAILQGLNQALAAPGRKSPGRVLAAILGKLDYADKIALYASGDQNRLTSVLRARGPERDRALACLFGYWLWDSVLRYPGVVLNEIGASSYLNIKEDIFRRPEVQSLFNEARYSGPFADAQEPLWWRGGLDDIIAAHNAAGGREFAAAQLGQEIAPSQCCEDPTKPAGYYCMFSRRPVSLDNSRPGLAWFPRGADLARISASKYDEVVPWL